MTEVIEQPEPEYEPTPEDLTRVKVANELVAEMEKWNKVSKDQWMIAYRLVWLINNPGPPPFHPDNWERDMIIKIQKTGLSMAQVGFVFDRSTATIFSVLNHKETEQTNV